jgi:maltose alpha-D-glucosyltransferase/alpha-amylase
VLPEFFPRQRWFGGKSRIIQSVRVADWSEFRNAALAFFEIQYERGESERYFLPLAMTFGKAAHRISEEAPAAVLCAITSKEGEGVLHDAIQDDEFSAGILAVAESSLKIAAHQGSIEGYSTAAFNELRGSADAPLPVRRGSSEQGNSWIIYGDRLILKLFHPQHTGPNPNVEIGKYLTETVHYDRIPPFAGAIEYVADGPESPESPERSALAILQGLVANEGDGWSWTIEELERYYENCAREPFPGDSDLLGLSLIEVSAKPISPVARDHVGAYLESAATLGRRTAELHLALAGANTDPAFAPEPFTGPEVESTSARMQKEAARRFDLLKDNLPKLPDEILEVAGLVLGRRRQIIERIGLTGRDKDYGQRIRTHGDYHLGQVLRAKNDFVILDFEGEPARSLADLRAKSTPLQDVAGMLRSFSYAANATLLTYTARHPEDFSSLEQWARLWERAAAGEFLCAYRKAAANARFLPDKDEDFRKLLDACLLEKALWQLEYELNHRPAWLRIPLAGILSLSV